QTTLIPAGGAAIVEFKVDVPGTFIIVDHSIFRAFNKGALGMLKVEGEENKRLYSGKQVVGIYNPEGGYIQDMPDEVAPEPIVAMSVAERIDAGKQIYSQTCFACHQAEGQGVDNAFPPLAKADYLNDDIERAIEIVLFGKRGEITVNGNKYSNVMQRQRLSDEEVANVLTYIYNNWENNKAEVTPNMVAKVRTNH
ncbi:MAG: c-type cytochrome, partial [Flavobacteriales bacterium]|nr:c-type cytochrome [Flavobacteriales bacterium]